MDKDVFNKLMDTEESVVIFDIDGTLKDLCYEHETALRLTLKAFNIGKIRTSLILIINFIAMVMIKTGLFSTNHTKQKLLTYIFSIFGCVNIKEFSEEYYNNYSKQLKLFNDVYDLLGRLSIDKQIYFLTINKQNYNLEKCGIPQEKIVYTTGKFKMTSYKNLVERLKVDKSNVLVVGDNIFDDLLSAKIIGVKCLLVNNYNSRLKKLICKLLKNK